MKTGIEGRVAFVTGASKGLGRATAEMLAGEGCNVAVVARGRAANDETVARIEEGKTLAAELGPLGITVNTISTGRFDTDSNKASVAEIYVGQGIGGDDHVAKRMMAIPLRRHGLPEEMAARVTFLAATGGGYVAGETICCDGGRNEAML